MKLSVSLPDEDVALLDAYARTAGLPSRSAALQRAVQMLRHSSLEQDYEAAWQEWADSGEQDLWSRPPAMDSTMLRGEIRLVDLEPVRGAEASKRRPAVIVSNDRANAVAIRLGRGIVTVVPVTSTITQVYPFQTLLPSSATGLKCDSKTQAEQVRSVAVERVGGVLGRLSGDLMTELDEALRLHLQL